MVVTQLWRYPVKSMGGHRVEQLHFDQRGAHADRLWAVRDLENAVTVSARRMPKLLGCSARYVGEPGPDAGPGNVPPVVITFPDGDEYSCDDPQIHSRLGELLGHDVRLTALPPVADTSQQRLSMQQTKATYSAAQVCKDLGITDTENLPDTSVFTTKQLLTLARYSTPPGTFVDLSPVHLLSTASLTSLSPDGSGYDVRRFRPNIVVDVDRHGADRPGAEFPEAGWVGASVGIGSSTLQVVVPTIRCVVPTRPQPGIELDRSLTRTLVQRTNRFLGIYADVSSPGEVRVGDEVDVRMPASPSALRRIGTAAEKTAVRGLQRVLEATVLRDKPTS